jgi:CRP-like cAMP-binding protein
MEPAKSNHESEQLDQLFSLVEHPKFIEGLYWHRVSVKANTAVINKGERSERLYLVSAGKLSVMDDLELEDNRRIKPGLAEIGEGGVFGELALFDNEPHSCSVVALTDCDLIVLDASKLLVFLSANTEIGYAILFQMMQQLTGRFRKASRRTAALFAWGLKAHGIESHL